MIKRINKIRDFGIFKKFDWNNSIPTFNAFNILYGWNYSGKTTISRIFRCFELGQKHPDYLTATFELEDDQGNKFTENNLDRISYIRVFNSDFINNNLKWDTDIEPIFLLGQKNIELQKDLADEKQKLATKQTEKTEIEKKKKSSEDRIENALTNKARDIKNLLSIPNYNKNRFQPAVTEVLADIQKNILSSKEIQKAINTYKRTDKKEPVDEILLELPKLSDLIADASIYLATTVKTKVIERLRASPKINQWVKEGKELHQGKVACEFCGNELPVNLLDDLSNHFSEDYDSLISNIQKQVRILNDSKISLVLPDEAKFYSEIKTDYSASKKILQNEITHLNETLQLLVQDLEAKQLKVFDALRLSSCVDNLSKIETAVKNVNQAIKSQNSKTTEFEKEKEKAFAKIISHYASEFAKNEQYGETQKNISAYGAGIETLTQDLKALESSVISIERQLSETVKGAEKINEYLTLYFGKEDLKVKPTQENKFQLFRSGIIAKNLSEGEKTAISFAYFITRLEDKNTVIADTIVFIDDPISSLDSNHLFNTYSFIKTKLSSCKQLYISTHNFEFFNLIKGWFSGRGMKKNTQSFYMIERSTNATTDQATIISMTPLIRIFNSEYCYLFSIIFNFKKMPNPDYYQLYNMPNILRRYLEALMSFKIPNGHGLESKLEILISNEVMVERVRKFIHHYSHSSSVTRSLQFPDLKECTDIVTIVLDSIAIKYKEHYDVLVETVTNTTVL